MPAQTNVPTFASIAEARRSISGQRLAHRRSADAPATSMAQAFARLSARIAGYNAAPERDLVHTTSDARRIVEQAAEGNCCIVTEDMDGLSLDLNCRSIPLSHVVSPEGLIRIGRNTFRVDRNVVALVDGSAREAAAAAALFHEFGYSQLVHLEQLAKTATSITGTVWQLSTRKQVHKYRVTLTVTQYTTTNGSVCKIYVKPELRTWMVFIPIWISTFVGMISIGGAFSGPVSPWQYKLPNPFNHVYGSSIPFMDAEHWVDPNPQYQVDSCFYDCSVYPYDANRIDLNVWK